MPVNIFMSTLFPECVVENVESQLGSRYLLILGLFLMGVGSNVRSQLVLDQSQLQYEGGLSARSDVPKLQLVGQSFRAGISGILSLIEVGFFNKIDGVVTFMVYEGEGNLGPLLDSQTCRVVCNRDTLFPFFTHAPITAGKLYTFLFMPGEG